ncbi:MAG: tRNA-dihydrouridine synthase [Alphaproteobacteria bacterium]|nr:tRNA-dihydrouridine synthase [Alphaproteobacteria bacterium]
MDKTLFLAPMAGVTDTPFRQIIRLFKTPQMITEMIAVEGLKRNHYGTLKMLRIEEEKDLIVQLVGVKPESFVYGAQMAENVGAIGIDINMGCPVKKLITNGSGAALINNPMTALKIVENVSKNVSIPVSVKTRLGWDSPQIDSLIHFTHDLKNAGACRIAIHARTKEQGYSGKADWLALKRVCEESPIPVIIDGDIRDTESLKQARLISGGSLFMIGRGCLGRPWIFEELATGEKPDFNEREIVLTHFNALLNYYGKKGIFIARKHLAWYAKGKTNMAEFCRSVFKETNPDVVSEMITEFF